VDKVDRRRWQPLKDKGARPDWLGQSKGMWIGVSKLEFCL
jgi:hypothetical protein